jgi:hypothetical protein
MTSPRFTLTPAESLRVHGRASAPAVGGAALHVENLRAHGELVPPTEAVAASVVRVPAA